MKETTVLLSESKNNNENSESLTSSDSTLTQEKEHSNLLLFDQSPVVSLEKTGDFVVRSRRVKTDYETCPEWIKLSTQVIVSTSSVVNKLGVVRFIGHTCFKPGIWIGVELDLPCGKNDGSLDGVKYFDCLANHGVFVRHDKITKYEPPANFSG